MILITNPKTQNQTTYSAITAAAAATPDAYGLIIEETRPGRRNRRVSWVELATARQKRTQAQQGRSAAELLAAGWEVDEVARVTGLHWSEILLSSQEKVSWPAK